MILGGIVSYAYKTPKALGRLHRSQTFSEDDVVLKESIFYHPPSKEKLKISRYIHTIHHSIRHFELIIFLKKTL